MQTITAEPVQNAVPVAQVKPCFKCRQPFETHDLVRCVECHEWQCNECDCGCDPVIIWDTPKAV